MLSRGDQGLDQCSNPHKLPPIGVLLLVLFTETHGICWGAEARSRLGHAVAAAQPVPRVLS